MELRQLIAREGKMEAKPWKLALAALETLSDWQQDRSETGLEGWGTVAVLGQLSQ